MKRILCMLFCIPLILSTSSAYANVFAFSGGSGTAEDPYQISTSQELRFLAERINAGDGIYNAAYYCLTADINLEKEPFIPIGFDLEHSFQGEFDGKFQMISGLRVVQSGNSEYHGLFGVLNGGAIRNLTVIGDIDGSLAGGGIVALNHGGTVVNCVANCTVDASYYQDTRFRYGAAGGIVGINENGGFVINSCYTNFYRKANVYGPSIVAVNQDDASRVVNCFSCGHNSGNGVSGSWENCYSLADNIFEPCDAFFMDESGTLIPSVREHTDDEGIEVPVSIINGETSLLGALNAWVDTYGSEEYQHWIQLPGQYPSFGNQIITTVYTIGEYITPGTQTEYVETDMETPYDFSLPAAFFSMEGIARTIYFPKNERIRLYDVLIDGESAGLVSEYTFPGDGKNHTVVARYVKSGSTANFIPDIPYNGYPDVNENLWYGTEHEGVIREATQLGLCMGDDKGNFNPAATLSLAEAVKLAAIIRDTYRGEQYPFDQAQGFHWFDTYVDYALDQGILKPGEFEDYERPATRGEMAHIFYGNGLTLPEYEEISDLRAPDVENHTYAFEVGMLYQTGILRGSDKLGTFHPDAPITRAEAAAIAVRIAVPNLRISY